MGLHEAVNEVIVAIRECVEAGADWKADEGLRSALCPTSQMP
jgi:hypothetical protein